MNVWPWNQRDRRFEGPAADIRAWSLVAADSWFVENGRVRAFDRHRARFARAAAQVAVGELVTDDFWAAVVAKIPATGEWFPRVDVLKAPPGDEPKLAFRLRPAPERTRELRVLVPPYSDPRTISERKGPDIALLEGVRADAHEQFGCDEVLLLSEDRYVIEGATTSLLCWEGDTLCVPDPELGALPGVTSAVIIEEASARSIPIESRRARAEDLLGHDVWLVNALHGIRRMRGFVDGRESVHRSGGPQSPGTDATGRSADRLDRWRGWLDDFAVPLGI